MQCFSNGVSSVSLQVSIVNETEVGLGLGLVLTFGLRFWSSLYNVYLDF
jgi:hypothetical protein